MRLYEAVPDGTALGALIVVMEAFGVNDHIEDVARRAAEAGFHAVAPDLFHRAGGGAVAYDDFGKLMEMFGSVSDEGVLTDIDATIAHLEAAGFDKRRIGIVGFCFGGRVTFLVAARRPLGAAVTYYGGGIVTGGMLPFPPLLDEAGSLQTPWLGHFGDKDAGIPVDDVERLRIAVAAGGVDNIVYRYDADHGFNCDARGAVYDPSASQVAWVRTVDWLRTHLA